MGSHEYLNDMHAMKNIRQYSTTLFGPTQYHLQIYCPVYNGGKKYSIFKTQPAVSCQGDSDWFGCTQSIAFANILPIMITKSSKGATLWWKTHDLLS